MIRSDEAALPARLPIRVRPVAGESVESYIRRLARANHLRPSLLHVYVRNPAAPATGAVRPERLAAASGSTLAALTHALVGLPKPGTTIGRPRPSQSQGESQAERKARLFAAIRSDAEHGLSMRQLAARHRTGFRMVRQALTWPVPPPRKRINRPISIPPPVLAVIDALLGQALTVQQIWACVVDEHEAEVSYGIVRDYVRSRQHPKSTQARRHGHGGPNGI
jgi:hypothetical protein